MADVTVQHPQFEDVTYTVPEGDAQGWVEAGYKQVTEDKPAEQPGEPATAGVTGQPSAQDAPTAGDAEKPA